MSHPGEPGGGRPTRSSQPPALTGRPAPGFSLVSAGVVRWEHRSSPRQNLPLTSGLLPRLDGLP